MVIRAVRLSSTIRIRAGNLPSGSEIAATRKGPGSAPRCRFLILRPGRLSAQYGNDLNRLRFVSDFPRRYHYIVSRFPAPGAPPFVFKGGVLALAHPARPCNSYTTLTPKRNPTGLRTRSPRAPLQLFPGHKFAHAVIPNPAAFFADGGEESAFSSIPAAAASPAFACGACSSGRPTMCGGRPEPFRFVAQGARQQFGGAQGFSCASCRSPRAAQPVVILSITTSAPSRHASPRTCLEVFFL